MLLILGSREAGLRQIRMNNYLNQNAQDTATRTSNAPEPLPKRSHRILVVDDNVEAADMLGELLTYLGHNAWVKYTSATAVASIKDQIPNIILIDIGLPDMDGHELAKMLRKMPETAHSVLIAITGYCQPSDVAASLKAGFDHHLVKPADFRTLIKLFPE